MPKKKVDSDCEEYRNKRQRNNEAVKKSRDKARQKAEETKHKVESLKYKNTQLKAKIDMLKKDIQTSKKLFIDVAAEKKDKLTPQELALIHEPESEEEEDNDMSMNPVSPAYSTSSSRN